MTTEAPHIVCPACSAVNRVAAGHPPAEARCGKCHAGLFPAAPVDLPPGALARFLERVEGPFVLDVWAEWCGPCRMMAPEYARAASHFGGAVRFFKLDSDADRESASALGVRGIPALFVYRGGERLAEKSGAMPAAQIVHWVASVTGQTPPQP